MRVFEVWGYHPADHWYVLASDVVEACEVVLQAKWAADTPCIRKVERHPVEVLLGVSASSDLAVEALLSG